MGDYHAPQWIDFMNTCSPQPPIPDFFETVHAVHERVLSDSVTENIENVQPTEPETNIPCINIKAQEDLNIIKSTPVKVISPKHRNKETVTGETTYEQVLSDAMKKLELCKKPLRVNRDILNKSQQSVFKTPNMPIIKSSRSVGCHNVSNKHVQYDQTSVPRNMKVNKNTSTPINSNRISVNMKKTSVSCSLFKENKDYIKNDTPKRLNKSLDSPKRNDKVIYKNESEEPKEGYNDTHQKKDNDEYNEEDKKECNENDIKVLQDESEEQTNDNTIDKENCSRDKADTKIEKCNQTQSKSNKRTTILTWQNRRRSLHKRRSVPTNNHYISMAEAVSRFQTETPKRFRTRSTKENQAISTMMNISKLAQNRLKPTIPISPALVSKNRTRAVTVLSQEQREKLQMEEIKKHPIKANPIPRNVLQGPRMKVTGVTKKQTTTNASSSSSAMQLNEKKCAANSLQSKNMALYHDKTSIIGPKNTVTKVLVTDPTGIIVEREEITFFGVPKDTGVTKSVTRVTPFSFEARNKNLQMKKEQRLKNLQEQSKTKAEFHARPAPNFSKPPMPSTKQQQQIVKKSMISCPFSFEERDKKVPKRKEQLVKQILEEDKRARVFRANPAPIFKPVMVRGRSKEHLLIRDKNAKTAEEHADKKSEDQENKESNVKTESKCIQKMNNALCIDKMPSMEKQEEYVKALPIELNTDKRAKERREFDEKMKRKEMEEEIKRQEENKKQLEHEKQIKAELRKLAEVKARPIPIYKPLIIDKATKQLTNPQSPAFASKLRMKQT
ncbi:hypothetical protein HN011_012550 [Eciton burchellii]|nr:hypothetical protein HN011_012550 [Eciton burchellii]